MTDLVGGEMIKYLYPILRCCAEKNTKMYKNDKISYKNK